MNQRNEWLSGNLPGSALRNNKKRHIGRLLGPETIFQPLSFLGLDGATPAQRGAWGALTAYVHGKEPGETHKALLKVVRLPQKPKKKHIINRSSKSNNFHPILSRNSHPWSHSVVSCFKILLGNQATPLPPNCPPLILHLANGKNSNFACKNGNLQSSFPEHKSKPLKITCQKKTENKKNSWFNQNWKKYSHCNQTITPAAKNALSLYLPKH